MERGPAPLDVDVAEDPVGRDRGVSLTDRTQQVQRITSVNGSVNTNSTGGGSGHNHTASSGTESAHTHTVDILPPFHALAYIMKL